MHPARLAATLIALSAAAAVAQAPRAPTAPPEPVPADPVVKRGVDLWQDGNYPGAIAAWRGPAERGDADAQFNMAQAYKLGRGVPADQRIAESWYRKAAEQGHEQAGGYLGLIMFQNGDRVGALPWLSKASDRGDPRAQYLYGTALFNGENVAKDWPRAYAMMTASAAAGLPQATATLQQMNQFIPAAERARGLKLAAGMRKSAPPATTRVATASRTGRPAPAAPRPTPKPVPVRTADRAPAPAAKPTAPKPVAPKVAAAKPAAPAAGGRWRVQVGAYGNEAAARTAWTALRARSPALANLVPTYQKAGAVVRLQLGPIADRAAANRICTASRAPACFPVAS
ncbi:SPOR domain-containing protein [Sphingomonas montana]|uniref:SPOR domain-containing protein n=1 Tax=Sphingomonas montana TaxID=1843236 RepID=UPI00096C6C26|nr:SPOR domain-containing protein [Sphingomonas montana]